MANYTWVGTDSSDPTDWNDPNNWTVAGAPATSPPGPNDSVTIDAGSDTVSIGGTGELQSASLTLTSSTGGSIDLTGTFDTGTLGLTGVLQLQGTLTDSGTASFADGATLEGGTTGVQGAATFGSAFTLENAELDLSTSSTATLSTLDLIGAVTLSGDITTTSLSDSGATSLTLGTGTFGVSSSTPSAPALLAPLTIAGDDTLAGAFSTSSLTVTGGAALNLNAGDSLTASGAAFDPSGSVSLTDGTLLITGNASLGSSLSVSGAGSLTVDGTLSTDGGSIGASDNSRVLIGELNGSGGEVSLSADGTSVIEIGSENTATTGTITIDSGIGVTAWGSFSAPAIVVNGTLDVANGEELSLSGSGRGLTGSGSVQIGSGSSLYLSGVDPGSSDTVQIDFAGSGGDLSITSGDLTALGAFVPTINGFSSTNVIDFTGSAITSATYASGILSLYAGATLAAALDIGTGYNNEFSVLSTNSGYQIDYLGGGTNAAPAGTTTADSYQWIGPVAGDWNNTANWADTTAAQSPASVAPGANDSVTIAAAANGAAQVLVGNGNAYGLTLEGETLLDGVFKVGAGGLTLAPNASAVLETASSLSVSGNATFGGGADVMLNGGTMSVTGTFYGSEVYDEPNTIENGGSLTVGALVDSFFTEFSIAAGSTLTVKGNMSDASGGGDSIFGVSGAGAGFTVKGTFVSTDDSVTASNGGQVQIAELTQDANGNGINLTVQDASSSIEIGTKGGVAAGTLTIDAGISVTEAGNFSAPTIVVNGTLDVANGEELSLSGTGRGLTGSGSVQIGSGSSLSVSGVDPGSSDKVQIDFAGSGGDLSITSGDLNSLDNFVPMIGGFGATDVIDFSGSVITSATYASGVLSLYDGTTLTASLDIGAGYTNQFSVLSLNNGPFQIDYLGGGTNGAPTGTTTADSYQWIGPVAGDWNNTANWADTTAAQSPASVAPGANDSVTIAAAANGAAQVLVGNGSAYGLTLEGETLLDGVFKVVGTGARGGLTLAPNASAVLDTGSSLSVSGNATFGGGADVTLNGGTMSVTGTFYGSEVYDEPNTIENGGSLTVGALVDSFFTEFSIAAGSTLTVKGNMSDASGGGDSIFGVSGAGAGFTVKGTFVSTDDFVTASNGGQVQIAELTQDANGNGINLTVQDASSSIEIGKTGGVAAGTLTIDKGISVTESGSFTAPTIVDNGTLTAASNESLTLTGAITGSGTLSIAAGAILNIDQDTNGSAVKIAFSGAGGLLALNANDLNASNEFVPTIGGFGATDVIDFSGATITSAQYASGVLSLYDGTTLTASLDIGAGFKNQFSVLSLNNGPFQIDYLGGGTNTAPAGTTTADSYQWIGPVAGDWNNTANWADTTAAQSPASVAPGANDSVTIAAAANGAAQVLVGNGNAYGLTLEGETLLDGVFKVGAGGLTLAPNASAVLETASSLSVSGNATFGGGADVMLNGGTMSVTGTFYGSEVYDEPNTIENGGSLTVGALVDSFFTEFSIAAGSTLTVKGNMSDASGGGDSIFGVSGAGAGFTVKGTFVSTDDFVTASNGGQVQIAELTQDANGNGINLTVQDASSSIEIGKTGGVAAGTLTIDKGISVTESGSFTAPTIVDNGTLTAASNESLTLTGAITGSGTLSIAAGAILNIDQDTNGSAVKIAFSGAGGLLALNANDLNASNEFVPTIGGFGATDVIDFSGATITSAQYASGVLSLYDGTTLTASLDIGAGFKNQFSVLSLNNGPFQIDYLGGGTNTAPAGTTTADSYQWIGPVAGDWNNTANWADTTAAQSPASVAPGANDSVTIAAAANGAAQVLVGNGSAYGLTLEGETLLDGVFKVVGTGARGGLTLAPNASAVLDTGSSLSVSGNATFGGGADVTLNGGTMSVTGTFYGSEVYDEPNTIENGGSLTVGALVDSFFTEFSIAAGSTLTVKGNMSDASGGGDSIFGVSGAGAGFTVKGTFVSTDDFVTASNGGQVQIAELTQDANGNGINLTVQDASSSIEIGKTGGVAAGTLTIDKGISVTESGSFTAPTIVDNGTLTAASNESLTLTGAITGSGTLSIAAGAILNIDQDTNGSAVKIAFSGAGGLLALNANDLNASNEFVPTIGGFGATDVIDFSGATITSAQYASGVLSLYDGTTLTASLDIGAGFKNQFSVLSLNNGPFQIDYLGGGTNTAPAGTTTADSYQWIGPVAGDWNNTANWADTTAAQSPASVAPGANDSVTIGAAANGAAQVLVGNGSAYGLTLEGETLLDGVFQIGAGGLAVAPSASAVLDTGSSLSVSGNATFGGGADVMLNGGTMSVTGTFYGSEVVYGPNAIENGGSLTVGALVDSFFTEFSIAAGSTLTVKGNVSDAGGNSNSVFGVSGAGAGFTVKGTFVSTDDTVTASNGGQVQLAELTQDANGNGVTLNVADASSSIEIGKTGGVAAGTLTIDDGVSVTETGSFTAPTIVDNGTLTAASNESLTLTGAIAGSGTLSIAAGSTLSLDSGSVAATDMFAFVGSGGTLSLATPLGFAASKISDFASGDAVDLAGSWSLVKFSENPSGTAATLTLTNGTNDLALKFEGDYTQGNFSITSGSTTTIDFATVPAAVFSSEMQSSTATNNIATIDNFDFSRDQFALWLPVTGIDSTVTASTLSGLGAAFGTNLNPGHAALADIGTQVYLVVDTDGKVGYHADDLMFALSDAHNLSSLSTVDFAVT
jgi:fibronectin-binding autotransporter adhesin